MELTSLTDRALILHTPIEEWATQVERDTGAWTRRTRLIRTGTAAGHFDAITVGRLAARVYPRAMAEKPDYPASRSVNPVTFDLRYAARQWPNWPLFSD